MTDRDMLQLIAEWNVISHGTTASPGGTSSGDSEHPGGKQPPGGGMSGADWWARYTSSLSPSKVCDQLRATIRDHTHSSADRNTTEPPADLTARIRGYHADGWPVKEIALTCRCTPTRVRQALAAPQPHEEADRDRVVALAAQGVTVRGISMRTGIARSTVHDILKRAA